MHLRAPPGQLYGARAMRDAAAAGTAAVRRVGAPEGALAGEEGHWQYAYYPKTFRDPYLSRRRKVGWDLYALLGLTRDNKAGMQAQHGRKLLWGTANLFGHPRYMAGAATNPDPDVFAFWHSSQADSRSATRLNFSEYKSAVADKALEGGRTRSEEVARAAKYKPFLDAWQQDTPALALYQPRYLYVVRDTLYGLNPTSMNSGADRFNNVENWMVRITQQPITR